MPRRDPRAVHILEVLRLSEGDSFLAGIVDGLIGRATLRSIDAEALAIDFEPERESPPLDPITLIVGLPRPQTAKKVLHEATAMGVQRIHFVRSDLGERSYAHSPLWKAGEYRRHLIDGAMQAVSTRLPEITVAQKLIDTLREEEAVTTLALDNVDAALPLSGAKVDLPATIAIGSERGWSDAERQVLRDAGYSIVHLGSRVLRVETATVAALALVKAQAGLI
ncbi:MAG: 16S rRNA (uracil(1498)-N(3))-methyltransferase [Dehalococcoidia bacterium]